MASSRDGHSMHARAQIAELAARLMAEHGLHDYTLAKRKAARQLGLPEGGSLPSNEEVDSALLERQALFEPEEQALTLGRLRHQAREVMRVFERFRPVLTGGVASGVVSEHSLIELEISQEVSKDFEQFLVNRNIEYKVQDKAGRMAYLIYSEPADVLVRLVTQEIRHGGTPHMSMDRLNKWLADAQA